MTNADQTAVHFLWTRDSQSPAAGVSFDRRCDASNQTLLTNAGDPRETKLQFKSVAAHRPHTVCVCDGVTFDLCWFQDVLYGSDTQPSLYLANLVEGTYLFQLKVTNAQGRSGSATATVEVRPGEAGSSPFVPFCVTQACADIDVLSHVSAEPGGGEQVELEMLVSVSQVSVAQRDTVVRQLAALIHVLDSDLHVRALQGHSHIRYLHAPRTCPSTCRLAITCDVFSACSTVLRFSVHGTSGPLSASRLVGVLRSQLLFEKSDYLLFRVLRVDTVCESSRGTAHL